MFESQVTDARKTVPERLRITVTRTLPFLALSVAYMRARVFALGFRGALGLQKFESMTVGSFAEEHRITEILMTLPAIMAECFKLLAVPWLAGACTFRRLGAATVAALYGPAAALFVFALAAVLRSAAPASLGSMFSARFGSQWRWHPQ